MRYILVILTLSLVGCGESNDLIGEWEFVPTHMVSKPSGIAKQLSFKENLMYADGQGDKVNEYLIDGDKTIVKLDNKSLTIQHFDNKIIQLHDTQVVYKKSGTKDSEIQGWLRGYNTQP